MRGLDARRTGTGALVALLVPLAACSGGGAGDDGPRPLERIDRPAEVQPNVGGVSVTTVGEGG